MTEAEQRAAVISEAMTWRGTPFHDNAEVKGAGVDCAHFVHACYVGAGVIPDMSIEAYSPQHMFHRDQELFLSYVERVAREIPLEAIRPADLILFRIARVFAHGAIALGGRRIIHAHKQSGCVLAASLDEEGLSARPMRAFSFWGR